MSTWITKLTCLMQGTLGPIGNGNLAPADYLLSLTQTLNCNLTASFFLASELLRKFDSYRSTQTAVIPKLVIVGISSLCGIQPFEHFSTYCASKAARDMFYRVPAAERVATGDNHVRVLNYAPGPMDTAMVGTILSTQHAKQEAFISMRENNSFVPTAMSASLLARLVLWEAFTSGAHVDYFDPLPEGPGVTQPTTCCACENCSCGVDCACKRLSKKLCDSCGITC